MKLAEQLSTSVVFKETIPLQKNTIINSFINIGDHVNIGDPILRFDSSFDDSEMVKFMATLSDEYKSVAEEVSRRDYTAEHAGIIKDIKVYSRFEPSNLSPSLGKIVQEFFDRGNAKKDLLNKYDATDGILKAGYLLTDNTEPIVTKYNDIKGIKNTDVLIEVYIEHDDVAGVGDKIIQYSANKAIVSELIPKGYEPYSEMEPNEEISQFSSSGTISRRMVTSVLGLTACGKDLVYLKRRVKKLFEE